MEDYRLEQTGQEVQRILNGAAMDANLQAEVERATDAEGTLQDNIDAEEQARQDADGLLQQAVDDEEQRAKDAEEANAGEIEGIKALIPATATSANKLADTNYVNSSIQTATAEYRGDYNVVTDLHLAIDATHAQIETLLPTVIAEADKNDYCYVMIPTNAQTPTEIAKIERYKMTSEGWKFEYDVNNSTFTAEEWAAIKSGITSGLVAKLNALPTNADLLLLLAGKQDVLTFDYVPVPESNNPVKSGGVYSAIDDEKTARLNSDTAIHTELDGLQAKVPATASSDNKLVDQNQMNSSISTATATFRGDWNVVSDLHLAVDATHAQIATLLGSTIAGADNNDYCYVEIPTSAETPTQIASVERYKFNGTAWGYEYTLNNSGFTADQWAAINSMITSGLVAKLSALPTNADLLAMLAQKQDNLTFDSTPTENSTNPVTSGGVFAADKALSDAIEAILLLIPSAASALNKLVDTALLNSSISTATATFRGTYNLVSDLGLGIDATEGQIAAALSTAISTADNNDYSFVQIPTSAQTPAQIARTDRYKFNGTAWGFEYTLNTSGFTAAQWAAINSGVTDTLVAELANIANLIPSEASQYNKLADKVYVITQIIAHIADFKGEYGTLLELQSVSNPKPGDLGIVRTKDNDGKDVYTFYQYKDSLWNEYYTLSYHPQIKPATTGTTGDYPYNGMGRVELPMNMVNGVNTLTQDMFYKGTVGFREPNTNTIFVIRYDFTLGEDITVPANCVLEFDGGSISGGNLVLNNTLLTGNYKFGNMVSMTGSLANTYIETENINFTSTERELYYIIKLHVPYVLFKKNGQYSISTTPDVKDHNSYFIVSETCVCDVVWDFNGATITDNRTDKQFAQASSNLENITVKNLTYKHGQNTGCTGAFIVTYNGASNVHITNSFFENVGEILYVMGNRSTSYYASNITVDAEIKGRGYDAAEYNSSEALILCGVNNVNVNLKATEIRAARLIASQGVNNAVYNIDMEDVSFGVAAFLMQEWSLKDDNNENVFIHCANITYNIKARGSINGQIVFLGNYVGNYDPSVAVFKKRTNDVMIPNTKINIDAYGVTTTPTWVYSNPSGPQIDINDEPMDVKFFWDLKYKLNTKNCAARQSVINLNGNYTQDFSGMCFNGDITYLTDMENDIVESRVFWVNDLSHIRFKTNITEEGQFRISSETYDGYKPTIETLDIKNVALMIDDQKDAGNIVLTRSFYYIVNASASKAEHINSIRHIEEEFEATSSDRAWNTPRGYNYLINIDQNTTHSFDVTNMAKNEDARCVLHHSWGSVARNVTLSTTNNGVASSTVTYAVPVGGDVIIRYGKINGNPYLYAENAQPTS